MEFILLLKVPKWPSNNEDSMNYRDSLDVNSKYARQLGF